MRAIERKRPPLMTARRWLFIVIAALITFAVWFGLYFREIQMPRWSQISSVQAMAVESGQLASVQNVNKHIWDQPSWVVEGVNSDEEEVYLFLTDSETLFTIKKEDSISPEALRTAFLKEKPNASIRHIKPGLFYGKPIWEINYTLGNGDKHYYYEFYTFEQGTWLDMYRLPAKTGR